MLNIKKLYTLKNKVNNANKVTPTQGFFVRVHIKSYHPYYINQFVASIYPLIVKAFNCKVNQTFLPKTYSTIAVLRSPHVDKKAQDHFESVIFHRELCFPIVNLNWANLNLLMVILLKSNALKHSVKCTFTIGSSSFL